MALVPGATILTLDGRICAAWSDASRGDLRPTRARPDGGPGSGAPLTRLAADLATATAARIDEVAWATQVHGPGVAVIDRRRGAAVGPIVCRNLGEYDAVVSTSPGTALCVLTADCAPIALASPEGVHGAVHAGWRGLVAGVVAAAVDAMRQQGATEVTAALGPCIHAACYQFSPADLDVAESALGPAVRGTTADGRPALDLVAGVTAAVVGAGARLVGGLDVCTACGSGQYSHRARADVGRQALLVWSTAPTGGS